MRQLELTPGDSKQQRLVCFVVLWQDIWPPVGHPDDARGNSCAGDMSALKLLWPAILAQATPTSDSKNKMHTEAIMTTGGARRYLVRRLYSQYERPEYILGLCWMSPPNHMLLSGPLKTCVEGLGTRLVVLLCRLIVTAISESNERKKDWHFLTHFLIWPSWLFLLQLVASSRLCHVCVFIPDTICRISNGNRVYTHNPPWVVVEILIVSQPQLVRKMSIMILFSRSSISCATLLAYSSLDPFCTRFTYSCVFVHSLDGFGGSCMIMLEFIIPKCKTCSHLMRSRIPC